MNLLEKRQQFGTAWENFSRNAFSPPVTNVVLPDQSLNIIDVPNLPPVFVGDQDQTNLPQGEGATVPPAYWPFAGQNKFSPTVLISLALVAATGGVLWWYLRKKK